MDTQAGDTVELENMVDRHGLVAVLSMLADVCSEKAMHVESVWQDRHTMRVWNKASDQLSKVAGHSAIVAVDIK